MFGNEKLSCVKATQDQINKMQVTKDDNQIVSTDCTKTYVPDDNFEQVLIDLGYDSVLDDYVLKANIMDILNLDLTGKEISDIDGIQDFIGLLNLKAGENNFSSINLSNITNLNELDLHTNSNLNSIIFPSSSENLKKINLQSCNLESIDISSISNLEELKINNNTSLTSLDLSMNTKLRLLWIYGTAIRTIDLSQIEYMPPRWSQEFQKTPLEFKFDSASDAGLYCVKVDEEFLVGLYADKFPDGWSNKISSSGYTDIRRMLCYEEIINTSLAPAWDGSDGVGSSS